jgi:hypothetical protein
MQVKQHNEQWLQESGVGVNLSLPRIEAPEELRPRTAQQVATRAWVLSYVRADLNYRLHWAARQSRFDGPPLPTSRSPHPAPPPRARLDRGPPSRLARHAPRHVIRSAWTPDPNVCNLRALPSGRRHRLDTASPSSRGLGHRPFTAVTRVRIPLGTPFKSSTYVDYKGASSRL